MRVLLHIVQSLFNQISEKKAFRPVNQPLILAYQVAILEEICEFKATRALSRAKSTFGEHLLQGNIILWGVENFCGKLRSNNRCKTVSHRLLHLSISHVDRTPALPRRQCPKFFSCSRYTRPSTKHGYQSGLQITLYF